ncbi:hypothetical protein SLS58_000240 [Diplodia intermedia]|uniref:Uncharacterized protein n=1 Tax=Diplodia intermedia TaxID=856260 RepID=A0ABR3U574_9PEZI
MHAAGLFTALLMGASTASAFALVPRIGQAVKPVTLWNGPGQKNGNDADGSPFKPQSYTFSPSDGKNSCFNLGGLAIDQKATSITVPDDWYCILWANEGCEGASTPKIFAGGINNLGQLNFDNKTRSRVTPFGPVVVFVRIVIINRFPIVHFHRHFHRHFFLNGQLHHLWDFVLNNKLHHFNRVHQFWYVHDNFHLNWHFNFDRHFNLDRNSDLNRYFDLHGHVHVNGYLDVHRNHHINHYQRH